MVPRERENPSCPGMGGGWDIELIYAPWYPDSQRLLYGDEVGEDAEAGRCRGQDDEDPQVQLDCGPHVPSARLAHHQIGRHCVLRLEERKGKVDGERTKVVARGGRAPFVVPALAGCCCCLLSLSPVRGEGWSELALGFATEGLDVGETEVREGVWKRDLEAAFALLVVFWARVSDGTVQWPAAQLSPPGPG